MASVSAESSFDSLLLCLDYLKAPLDGSSWQTAMVVLPTRNTTAYTPRCMTAVIQNVFNETGFLSSKLLYFTIVELL